MSSGRGGKVRGVMALSSQEFSFANGKSPRTPSPHSTRPHIRGRASLRPLEEACCRDGTLADLEFGHFVLTCTGHFQRSPSSRIAAPPPAPLANTAQTRHTQPPWPRAALSSLTGDHRGKRRHCPCSQQRPWSSGKSNWGCELRAIHVGAYPFQTACSWPFAGDEWPPFGGQIQILSKFPESLRLS
jgi:hypothetical protein